MFSGLTDPPYNIAQYSTGNINLPGRSALNNDLGKWDLNEIDPFVFVFCLTFFCVNVNLYYRAHLFSL